MKHRKEANQNKPDLTDATIELNDARLLVCGARDLLERIVEADLRDDDCCDDCESSYSHHLNPLVTILGVALDKILVAEGYLRSLPSEHVAPTKTASPRAAKKFFSELGIVPPKPEDAQ